MYFLSRNICTMASTFKSWHRRGISQIHGVFKSASPPTYPNFQSCRFLSLFLTFLTKLTSLLYRCDKSGFCGFWADSKLPIHTRWATSSSSRWAKQHSAEARTGSRIAAGSSQPSVKQQSTSSQPALSYKLSTRSPAGLLSNYPPVFSTSDSTGWRIWLPPNVGRLRVHEYVRLNCMLTQHFLCFDQFNLYM